MKICLITDAWTPVWGGGQTHIWEVASRLSKEGYDIDVLVPNIKSVEGKIWLRVEEFEKGRLRILRIGPVFIFPGILGRGLNLLADLWWMATNNYDIYHSHSNAAVLLPIIKLLHPKRKVVYTIHGAGMELVGGGIWNKLGLSNIIRWFWRLLVYKYPWDGLVTVARQTVTGKCEAKQFVVIGNGVNVSRFDKVKAKKDPKRFRILWVGRKQDPIKGVKYLEEAFSRVKIKYSQTELLLVDNLYGEDLIEEYKTANLFVLPSLSEGFPITVLEAMAAKLPVVATAVGAVSEIVVNGVTGYIVPAAEPKAIVEAVAKLISEKTLRRMMGERGHERVKQKYSWDTCARETLILYKSI